MTSNATKCLFCGNLIKSRSMIYVRDEGPYHAACAPAISSGLLRRDDPAILELVEALRALIELPDTISPFGGELQQDRIERTYDRARAAIAKWEGKA